MRYLYRKGLNQKDGFLVGVFMTALFSIRFLVEFIKQVKADLKAFTSIIYRTMVKCPLIIAGIIVMYRTRTVTP